MNDHVIWWRFRSNAYFQHETAELFPIEKDGPCCKFVEWLCVVFVAVLFSFALSEIVLNLNCRWVNCKYLFRLSFCGEVWLRCLVGWIVDTLRFAHQQHRCHSIHLRCHCVYCSTQTNLLNINEFTISLVLRSWFFLLALFRYHQWNLLLRLVICSIIAYDRLIRFSALTNTNQYTTLFTVNEIHIFVCLPLSSLFIISTIGHGTPSAIYVARIFFLFSPVRVFTSNQKSSQPSKIWFMFRSTARKLFWQWKISIVYKREQALAMPLPSYRYSYADIFHDWLNSLEIIVEFIFNQRTSFAIFVHSNKVKPINANTPNVEQHLSMEILKER